MDEQDYKAFSWWQPLRVVNLIISIPLNIIGLMALLEQKVNWHGILQGLVDKYKAAARYFYDALFGWIQFTPPDWFVDYLPVALTFYLSLNFSLFQREKKFSTFLCWPSTFRDVFIKFYLYKFPGSRAESISRSAIFLIYLGIMLANTIRTVFTVLLSPIYLVVMFLSKLFLVSIGIVFFSFHLLLVGILRILLAILLINLTVAKVFSFTLSEGKLFEAMNYEAFNEWLAGKLKVYSDIKATLFAEIIEPLLFLFLNWVKGLHHSVDKKFFKEWVPVIGYQYTMVAAIALIMICLVGVNNVLK